MEKMRILVANDPRVYREVIADALEKLRPLVGVHRAEPAQLEREVRRVRPHLVLCSQKIDASVLREAGRPIFWVVLYPDGENRLEVVEVGVDRTSVLSGGAGVADLLKVVDETELSWRSAAEGGA